MNGKSNEWILLSEHGACSLQHLAEVSGLLPEELDDLIQNGIIRPSNQSAQPASFSLRYIGTASMARRLRDDFELDRHGLVLALILMQRIDELESELQEMQARLIRAR